MKKKYILPVLLFISVICFSQDYKRMMNSDTFTLKEIQKEANAYFAMNGQGKGTGYKQFKRWEYNARRKVDENGFVKKNSFYINELKKYNAILNTQSKYSREVTNSWEQLGPTNYTVTSGYNPGIGRITCLDIDKSDANHMIVGAHTGGVWRTTDKGANWTSLSDTFTTMSVSSLTMHPTTSSTYFWGSNGGDIYKSTDSGSTWSTLANLGGGEVNKVIINPNNTAIMFATALNNGVYKTIDGGANWTQVTTDTDGLDVEFKPGDYNTIYASGLNFNKSTDGGATWSVIAGFDSAGLKLIGVTPHNPEVVYVVEEKSGKFNGLYTSTDSGAVFSKKEHTGKNYFGYETDASDTSGQAPRDMAIAVSTTNSNEVHIGGIISFRSMDGGTTFTATSNWNYGQSPTLGYCHADIDDMMYNGTELFVVSDGGVFVATNPSGTISSSYFTDLTNGMGIHQFYKIGVFQDNTSKVTGGSQDNGTSSYTNSVWKNWWGADGGPSFFHNTNSNIIYGSTQEGGLVKSLDGGQTVDNLAGPPMGKGIFITPIIPDPIDAETLYIGFEEVFKSTDGALNWNSISQTFPSKLDLLAIAPTDNKIMFAVYGDNLFKTTTGAGTWAQLNGFSGFITDVEVHPTDATKIAISTAGPDNIYISSDGGTTWQAKTSAGLPGFSPNTIAWQNNNKDGLYVGMTYGVYYIDNTLASWQNYANLLPNVTINDLVINNVESKLYAGTFGRGVWKITLNGVTLSSENNELLSKNISVFPNPASNSLNINSDLNSKAEIRLFSIDGKLLYFSKKKELSNHKIDISNLSSGIYFVRINSENYIFTKKIIKE